MTRIAWGHRYRSLLCSATAAIALGFALAMSPTLALAETQISGKPDAVSVKAQDASVEEILVALANAFDVQFRSSADLEKRLTGTYKGSLQQVVSRILAGYTFFVKSDETGLEITLLGSGKTIAMVGASSASKVAMRRADATTEPSPVADPVERPVPVPVPSLGGPIPTKTLAEGPRPMPSASGSAPGPVPGPALSSVPLPSPGAPGSPSGPVPGPAMSAAPVPSPLGPGVTPPVPERGASAVLPPPVPGTTPFPAPPSAR
jgi:hypothetical protein